jgi:hypothetical protein
MRRPYEVAMCRAGLCALSTGLGRSTIAKNIAALPTPIRAPNDHMRS